MKIINYLFLILGLFLFMSSKRQTNELNGKYEYKTNDFVSIYQFNDDDFSLIEIGDLGAFYGKGKFKINKSSLILNFDTLNIKKVKPYVIIPPKADTLSISYLDKNTLDISYEIEGKLYLQKYKRKRQ